MNNRTSNQENILNDSTFESTELMADVYLVELSSRFSVISCAPRSRRLVLGSDISEILSFNVSHELRKYLLSYGKIPVVIPTFVGGALILPQLFASSRLFLMVFFKNERPDALARVAALPAFLGRVEPLACGGECGKVTKWDESLSERLDAFLNITESILSDSAEISAVDSAESVLEKCRVLFDGIFELTGVSADISVDDDICLDESFDAKLFSAFCISTLMLCARHARSDSAEVRIFQKGLGVTVGISFASGKKISRVLNPDVAHFCAISDANNMIFESRFECGCYETVLTPARKDWSLLELKFPSEFTI